jgi:hypothetical protein
MFPPAQQGAALALLEAELGRRFLHNDGMGAANIERIRCAALKLSEGSLDKLRTAVGVANTDWRDTLVAAGFGHSVTAHLTWLDDTLSH